MDEKEILSLVEHLEHNIDQLEERLEPLLSATLTTTTKKLPVLDKAKLYVLIVYSIESLLFSYIRLNGLNPQSHPVFKELARVKQYFEKIQVAEEGPGKPRENLSVNKQAASRVIKHALAGNDRYDLERAEREAKEKLTAKGKLQALDYKKDSEAVPAVERSEDRSDDNRDETEDLEIEGIPDASNSLKRPTSQSDNNDKKKRNGKQDNKRKLSKAEKRARKRKREQEAPEGRRSKKKKFRKGRKKDFEAGPAE